VTVQRVCGNYSVFCPANSTTPTRVTAGYYSSASADGTTQTMQQPCPRPDMESLFCPGDGLTHPCPPGRFGNSSVGSLNSSLCSGLCVAGYYCPGSTTDTSMMSCGGLQWYAACRSAATAVVRCVADGSMRRNDDRYCPLGSETRQLVPTGWYSTPEGGNVTRRSGALVCDPGYYCIDSVRYECPAGAVAVESFRLCRLRV
jgi:hypothetical protein